MTNHLSFVWAGDKGGGDRYWIANSRSYKLTYVGRSRDGWHLGKLTRKFPWVGGGLRHVGEYPFLNWRADD